MIRCKKETNNLSRLSLSDCSLDCTSLTGPCSSILNLVPALTSLSINNINSLPASVCR